MSSSSFGLAALDGLLEDALIFEVPLPRLAQYLKAKRSSAGNVFRSANTVSGGNIDLSGSTMGFYSIIPVVAGKNVMVISADSNYSYFSLAQPEASLNLSGNSNLVSIFYAVSLADFLDVGLGVNQNNNGLDARMTGIDSCVRFSPSKSLSIEYNAFKSGLINSAKIEYGQDIFAAPANGEQLNNSVSIFYESSSNLKFTGLFENNNCQQDANMVVSDERYTYVCVGRDTAFGSIGVVLGDDQLNFKCDLLASETKLASSSGIFASMSPDMVLDGESIDKTADLSLRMAARGLRLGVNKAINDRVKLGFDFSFLKLIFAGDAKVWDSFFFGLVRKLDSAYAAPLESADVATIDLGARYQISRDSELKYSFKQLIPISVVNKGPSGTDSNSNYDVVSDSAMSGGNTQTLAMTWYF